MSATMLVTGKAACRLADAQGFRVQFIDSNTHWTTGYGGRWSWCYSDERYRVHPDDQAAFIAKNTPAPVGPKTNPRLHAEFIKAWADGAEIEFYNEGTKAWEPTEYPAWLSYSKYRLKEKSKPQPTREQLLKSTEASKRKYLKRKAGFEEHKARLQRMMAALDEQYAQKKIRREALLRNT